MVEPRLIKKYPNRRLYDTHRSCYIVLADIRKLICEGGEVKVIDSQSHDDITRGVLLQIIAEREHGPERLLSSEMLLQWIRCRQIRSDAFVFANEQTSRPAEDRLPVADDDGDAAPLRPNGAWRDSTQELNLRSKEP